MSLRKRRIALVRGAAVPVIFLAVFVRPTWSTESTVAFCVELAGYSFLLAGLAVRMWSILYIGGRKSHELVTDGPYSICRNPLYLGTSLLAIGAGLCFENVLMLIAVFLIIAPVHLLAARMEERHLLELFPDTYPEYARRVPRFWPRLSNYRSRETVTVRVRAIRRIAIDTVGVLLLPEIEDLLEVLHQHNIVPVLLHFP
jgi:protein-S-isoprenylcysteine O-methyltransferase Ste14